jgi:hypothetical protein
MKDYFSKIRPQIFLAIVVLGIVSVVAMRADMVEVTTGAVALVGALGMKVLESE